MSTLKFYVSENDEPFSLSHMSEPECYAIQLCVEELLPKPQGDYWFEVDTCLFDEEEEQPRYGLLRCWEENPNPKNLSQMESRLPIDVPKELLETVEGKTFRVHPKQYGLNPWGKKVEIQFESLPKKGVKASVLIQAALQAQKVN